MEPAWTPATPRRGATQPCTGGAGCSRPAGGETRPGWPRPPLWWAWQTRGHRSPPLAPLSPTGHNATAYARPPAAQLAAHGGEKGEKGVWGKGGKGGGGACAWRSL